MTKTECLEKLLHHGPMTDCQLLQVTGWPIHEFEATMAEAKHQNRIERCHFSPTSRGPFTAWKAVTRNPVCEVGA